MSTSAYSPTSAARSQPEGAALKYPDVRNYISGRFAAGGDRLQDINDPSDGSLIARVPMGGAAEVDAAVAAARAALPGWASTPIKERVQVFFRYKALLEQNLGELSALISEEHGKVQSEADAEILKAIELTEFACSMPQLVAGETMEVSRGVECRVERYPVGIVASIVPFNFPSMVPHWTIPNAIVLGNCFILKPSERVPLSAQRIATLLTEAGLPPGVFNTVNGGREAVEAILDHPGIEAVTFVGSTAVAREVYRRGTSHLKRVLALGGAKNH
ncbi:MAG TPA: aldehyde dehydrogenase family protein, partial [Gemmatimonadales bacterium]|nr:aldehyde dehydrogenase family protein [Gemmatimonadales bacterium]